jgi:hypothetical protein
MRHHEPPLIHLSPWRTGQVLMLPELFDIMRCQFGRLKLSIREFILLDGIDQDVPQKFCFWCAGGADFAEGYCRAACSEMCSVRAILPHYAALERLQSGDSAWYNAVWTAYGAIGREFESLRAHHSRLSLHSLLPEWDAIVGVSCRCPEWSQQSWPRRQEQRL